MGYPTISFVDGYKFARPRTHGAGLCMVVDLDTGEVIGGPLDDESCWQLVNGLVRRKPGRRLDVVSADG